MTKKKKKDIIRKGSPFKPSDIEAIILQGMKDSRSCHRGTVKFYAGDVGHCPRRAVKYFVTDREEAVTPASTTYMSMGTAIHEIVTDALYKSGHLLFKEFRLPPTEDPDIRGILDAIIFDPHDKIVAMEIKSCGNLPAKPRPAHEAQSVLYSALTGFDIVILYLSRKVAGYDGRLMLKSFDVETTEEVLLDALLQPCLAYFAYQDGVLPPVPAGFSRERDCRFCPFIEECWGEDEEDLPEADGDLLDDLYTLSMERAEEFLRQREAKRKGILKHIQRYASPEIKKKLESISWA